MEISLCEIVLSKYGHDKEKYFLVVSKDNGFLYLSDGKSRKAQKPKKKNIKHVIPTGKADQYLLEKLKSGDTLTHKEIRYSLKIYKQAIDEKNY